MQHLTLLLRMKGTLLGSFKNAIACLSSCEICLLLVANCLIWQIMFHGEQLFLRDPAVLTCKSLAWKYKDTIEEK